ncbi:hypothetical protein CV102_21110 [Natronococcus pandeyae]|uniref:CARDB domain-containing protein n=1 Tax=Natronococcus pandeyae TaxID=2055836 RepID=A0A8J8TQK0_9EURY|nr:hypothetical protein [Natronococcus pandeyae]TYL36774.1 hypothetical protein CV102_21110 [Natronococcus pandeyae]
MHRRMALGVITGVSLAALTGGSTGDSDAESLPVKVADGGGSSASPDLARETPAVAFDVAPLSLTECGTTCREATTTLRNTGDRDATDVRVFVTVFTDETVVWETEECIGRLASGAGVTRTYRVDVDLGTALAIRENDGRLTIELTIESDQQTERIVREKDVEI